MKHGSLFSGIGGFDLAAQWMGWENVFHCEWNEFGQKVLKHHFPKSISYADITKTDFTIHRGTIDVLTGGFPCQPYSVAGKRLGKADDRHLWPQMLRAIREIQPRYVVGENVRGLLSWNGGMVFDEVQSDLENEGYEVLPFLLPACAVNAPHRRDRVWFVAHRHNAHESTNSANRKREGCESESHNRSEVRNDTRSIVKSWDATDTPSIRQSSEEHRQEGPGWTSKKSVSNYWQNFPTQSPICTGNDGIPSKLDGITFPKWRNESIKAAGNAIVPQVAFQIFKAIQMMQTP